MAMPTFAPIERLFFGSMEVAGLFVFMGGVDTDKAVVCKAAL